MKAAPLLVAWHDNNDPIYSAHFEPHGKGRLATAGGDANVRLWSIETSGDERKVTYLSTLRKHNQAVNVVRWCPRGELLASAGDDGNVLLWTPSDNAAHAASFGEDGQEDVEHWRVKTMCRSNSGSEIYDLAWSPDGKYFITGSMDNVARIYDAQNGSVVRQLAEHSHYVQGVAWDPLNEYVATQSSDRSVHIYSLKTKDGQFSLHNKVSKMDLPGRRISSNSPAPPDFGLGNHRAALAQDTMSESVGSPKPSAPGTPLSLALPMNPPPTSHSRRSSFGSQIGNSRRSVSPSPSMPLPAVMPSPSLSGTMSLGVRNANLYANETFTSFFRRLTFTPDGSLLFTPAGQYKISRPPAFAASEGAKSATSAGAPADEITNTVYIYTRAGLNKPPVAFLPGHKKPSVAVRCSPVYYQLRSTTAPEFNKTKEIAIDTRGNNVDDLAPLPDPVMPSKQAATAIGPGMEMPPPLNLYSAPSPANSTTAAASVTTMPSPRTALLDSQAVEDAPASQPESGLPVGPSPAFDLPYRMVLAVATQDAVLLYDTQQTQPLCVISNLHYATFTDLTWSTDGLTLLMTSSDGFCSSLTFAPGELGTVYHPPPGSHIGRSTPAPISTGPVAGRTGSMSNASTPLPTPTPSNVGTNPTGIPIGVGASLHMRKSSTQSQGGAPTSSANLPSPSPFPPSSGVGLTLGSLARPASPARSMSASSIATEASFARVLVGRDSNNSSVPNAHPTSNLATPVEQQSQPDLGATTTAASTPQLPTPSLSAVPSLAAIGSGNGSTSAATSSNSNLPLFTPPQTPGQSSLSASAPALPTGTSAVPAKRETPAASIEPASGEDAGERQGREKRRRIAPTLVSTASDQISPPPPPPPSGAASGQ